MKNIIANVMGVFTSGFFKSHWKLGVGIIAVLGSAVVCIINRKKLGSKIKTLVNKVKNIGKKKDK